MSPFFLAAMSSLRSDIVTQPVRLFVMKEFFFSLRRYNCVSRKSKGFSDEVSRMAHAGFMERKFQGVFQESFRCLSRMIEGCF